MLSQELVVGLHGLVMQFETNFGVVALQFLEEDRQKENAPPAAAITPSGWIVVGSGPSSGMEAITHTSPGSATKNSKGMRASFSTSHLSSFATNPPPVVSGENLHHCICSVKLFIFFYNYVHWIVGGGGGFFCISSEYSEK